MFRHGDVLILNPVKLPANAKQRPNKVVAEGEVTGHAHRITDGEVWESDNDLFITAGKRAALTHEEHARLPLPATGDGMAFPVIIQREYDDEQEWRQVAD